MLVALATTLLLLAGTVNAQADYYSGGMDTRSFNFRAVNLNATWTGYTDTSRGYWNNSGAGTSIGRNTTASATVTAASWSSQSWYGLYTPSGVPNINRTFAIQINVFTLIRDAGSNYSTWCLSTLTHELGHSLHLADNPGTTSSSLMKHSRNRTTIYKPQTYDVTEVKSIYA